MNGGLGPWIPHKKMYVGICAAVLTAGRKAANTKQFIKANVRSQGGMGAGSRK